jgi:hypothetical protein
VEITGGPRKLHNDELHNLYLLPDIMVKPGTMELKGNIAMGNVYKILVRKCKGKNLFRKPRWNWEDNTKRVYGVQNGFN